MTNNSETDDAVVKRLLQQVLQQPPAQNTDDVRRQNENTVKVIALLNQDLQPTGINQYETLRRMVRDDERLKQVYRGVVNPSKVVINAVQVFVKRASAEAGVGGGTRLDDVLMQGSAQKALDEIVKDILPVVVTNHVQDYMAADRIKLR